MTTTIDPDLQSALKKYAEGRAPVSRIVRRMDVVTCFSTLFAKWEFQEDGLIVQLFPRCGPTDEWFEGSYEGRERRARYHPGRGEAPFSGARFPNGFVDNIKDAANQVWMGEVKIDYVEELRSYVLLFLGLPRSEDFESEGGFLDRFLTKIDEALE